jgi:hypothetical protein
MDQEEFQEIIQAMIQTFVEQVAELKLRIRTAESERDELKRELEFLKNETNKRTI